jgi:hypothetical protein
LETSSTKWLLHTLNKAHFNFKIMKNGASCSTSPSIRSTSKVVYCDPFNEDACQHHNCDFVPTENTASKRAAHFTIARAHAATCKGSNCSACFRLWGCLAHEQAAIEASAALGVDVRSPIVKKYAQRVSESATSARSRSSTPRLSRRASSQFDGDDDEDVKSQSFASLRSSGGTKSDNEMSVFFS